MTTTNAQSGILAGVPRLARYLTFRREPGTNLRDSLTALAEAVDGDAIVAGLGASVLAELNVEIAGLRTAPALTGSGASVPSTPAALWCWLRGEDRGELVHASRKLRAAVEPAFVLERTIDAFQYGPSLDLTGYEDGTENPSGERADEVAIVSGAGAGVDGSSFVAVQQWVHDLSAFAAKTQEQRDFTIGRRLSDNEEIDDAPESAHVKRTEQEGFEPPAFVLRRSMPWANECAEGLVFVAFGSSLDPFETQLRRMVGLDDGITDALFTFTRPVSGAYFWCPPVADGRLDLRALGL